MTASLKSNQLALNFDLSHSMSRDDWVLMPCNSEAFHLCLNWRSWQIAQGLIIGAKASGKTHLARIWQQEAQAFYIDARSQYALEDIFSYDAIVIDNIDAMVGQCDTFFLMLNHLRTMKKPFLMTSCVSPELIGFKRADVLSRLRDNIRMVLHAPDEGLLRGMFAKLFADRQMNVSLDVIDYIVARMERSQEAVLKLVEMIDKMSLCENRAVTKVIASHALEQFSL